MHSHLDDLLFDLRRLPRVAIVQQEGTTGTGLLSAPVPLLELVDLVAKRKQKVLWARDAESPLLSQTREACGACSWADCNRWGWTRAVGQGMVAPSRGAMSWATPGVIFMDPYLR